jgi:ribosomal-protein-alanine N-acetyltransferase
MTLIDVKQVKDLNERSLSENYPREFWIEIFHKGKTHSFVCVFANLIIGYIFCDEGTIISLAIDEKFRNKGLGKQLLYNCLNTYITPVGLHVRVTNEIALNLYKSLNFIEEERVIGYYHSEDAYSMIRKPSNIKYDAKRVVKI